MRNLLWASLLTVATITIVELGNRIIDAGVSPWEMALFALASVLSVQSTSVLMGRPA